MSFSALYRFSGGALLVGGVLAIIGQLLQIQAAPGTPLWIPGTWLALGGTLLVLLGWPGLYFRQVHRAGRLGMLGFVLSFVALLIDGIGIGTVAAFVSPALAASAATRPLLDQQALPALLVFELLGGLLLIVGPFLFGIATIRAGVLPRWAALILIVGSVATLLTVILHDWNEVSAAILFLAIACFGFVLWSKRDATEVVPSAPVLKEARS
jgi:hypothetical protein